MRQFDPNSPQPSHRLVEKICQDASEAMFTMAPHDLSDLTHCIAALGVDVHRLTPDPGERTLSPVLTGVIDRLDRLHRRLVACFHREATAVLPDTACALLLHLVNRIANAEGVDLKILSALAAAKLQPGGGQDGHEVVDLARALRRRSVARRGRRQGPAA